MTGVLVKFIILCIQTHTNYFINIENITDKNTSNSAIAETACITYLLSASLAHTLRSARFADK